MTTSGKKDINETIKWMDRIGTPIIKSVCIEIGKPDSINYIKHETDSNGRTISICYGDRCDSVWCKYHTIYHNNSNNIKPFLLTYQKE